MEDIEIEKFSLIKTGRQFVHDEDSLYTMLRLVLNNKLTVN